MLRADSLHAYVLTRSHACMFTCLHAYMRTCLHAYMLTLVNGRGVERTYEGAAGSVGKDMKAKKFTNFTVDWLPGTI